MFDLKITDVLLIAATCAGPVLAVQAQKWVERWRADRDRKDAIFRTLMATRSMGLSPDHIRALNGIELAFYSEAKGNVPKAGSAAAVVEAWRTYFDHLNGPKSKPGTPEDARFGERSTELRCALLGTMAKHLRYDITDRDIKRGAYYPQFYSDAENDNHEIRQGLAKLIRGEITVPITFPGLVQTALTAIEILGEDDPEFAAKLERMRSTYAAALSKKDGDGQDLFDGKTLPAKRKQL